MGTNSIELKRSLGLFDAVNVIAGTIIGSAIFIAPASVARSLPDPASMLLAWGAAGLLSLFAALAFAELGGMMPATGGQYIFLREAYGPLISFLFGWTSFLIIQSAAIATLAVGFAVYVGYFIPLGPAGSAACSVGLIAVLTAVNYFGVREGAFVQNLTTVLKCAGIAVIVLAAFFGPRSGSFEAPFHGFSLMGFSAAMVGCLWSFEGWSNITFMAGELRNAQRDVPRSLNIGVILCIGLYILANLAYIRVLPMSIIRETDRVASLTAERAMGPAGGIVVTAAILISIIGSGNGCVMTAPRLFFAQARDGLFFASLGRVHPRFRTPHVSIAVQGIWAALLTLSGSYELLFSYVTFGAWVFYGLTVLAVVVLRRRDPLRERPYRVWGYPWAPLAFVATAFTFVLSTLYSTPGPSLLGLLTILSGVPAYWFWRRKQAADAAGAGGQK